MTIKDTFTPMADHLRSEYGVDGLLTTEQIKAGIGGLHVQNLLDEGQSYDSSVDTAGWKSLIGLNNKLALLPGKTITISFDVTWSGYDPGKQRLGIEYGLKFKNDPEVWAGVFYWPASTSGSAHVAKSFSLHQDTITGYDEGNFYAPNITGYVTKITNPKIVINPMGATKPNLLFNAQSKYLPNITILDNFDCNLTDPSSTIQMEAGSTYEVVAETNGYFSDDHEPNVESDKCVLFLTNSKYYSQIISSDSTSTGSKFTWHGPSGKFFLRVNTYHKAGKNTIYAYNIRIYKVN